MKNDFKLIEGDKYLLFHKYIYQTKDSSLNHIERGMFIFEFKFTPTHGLLYDWTLLKELAFIFSGCAIKSAMKILLSYERYPFNKTDFEIIPYRGKMINL